MTPAIEKAEREIVRLNAKVDAVLTNVAAYDDAFWKTKFLTMVDRAASAVNHVVNLYRKERGEAPLS